MLARGDLRGACEAEAEESREGERGEADQKVDADSAVLDRARRRQPELGAARAN
jgi:hypothetical protein